MTCARLSSQQSGSDSRFILRTCRMDCARHRSTSARVSSWKRLLVAMGCAYFWLCGAASAGMSYHFTCGHGNTRRRAVVTGDFPPVDRVDS